jgi:hypothetical protein
MKTGTLREESSMRQVIRTGSRLFAVVILASALVAGCASVPLVTEASTSGIRAAEAVGAAQVPRASLHLQLAKEELDQAKALAARGEKDRAVSLLARSEADSELAVALSREDAERSKTRAAEERVMKLRQANP